MPKNMLDYDDIVCEIKLETYEDLITVKSGINPDTGEEFPIDLKQECIFRGIGNKKYKLIPKAFRKDGEKYIISDYLNSSLFLNKYHSPIFDKDDFDDNELNYKKQFKRELFVLFNFLDWADKSGLKVPLSTDVRKLLHTKIVELPDHWPTSDFFEVMSLAQHFKLPTSALDWSYNYKVSLYFACESILRGDTSDCVLWAFNYKPFERHSTHQLSEQLSKYNRSQLRFYRPEYYNNPNIQAQKGLFTIIINNKCSFNEKSLDEMILNEINEDENFEISESGIKLKETYNYTFKNNEKVFYKFVISGDLKHEILKELYSDGYSEEYLFPGYHGVVRAMENRIKLEKYCKSIDSEKFDVLLMLSQNEIKNILDGVENFIFNDYQFEKEINKIFIGSKNKVYGYFNGDLIFKDDSQKLSQKYSNINNWSYKQCFSFKKHNEGVLIRINKLKKFKYPIKIKVSDKSKNCYIQDNDNLKFLLNFRD